MISFDLTEHCVSLRCLAHISMHKTFSSSKFSFVCHLPSVLCCLIYSFLLSSILIAFSFVVVLRSDKFWTLPLHSVLLPIFSISNDKHNSNEIILLRTSLCSESNASNFIEVFALGQD